MLENRCNIFDYGEDMKILDGIEYANLEGLTTMPQRAATAWSAVSGIIGCVYEPLIYIGTQVTKGVNYWFIAKQTITYSQPETHVVKLAVNEYDGKFILVPHSIEIIF